MAGLIIPFTELSRKALQEIIQEFVTIDGTDHGESEIPMDTKVQPVLNQLQSGNEYLKPKDEGHWRKKFYLVGKIEISELFFTSMQTCR
jgi:uncharacterized protein YheU (UPF0270 family)